MFVSKVFLKNPNSVYETSLVCSNSFTQVKCSVFKFCKNKCGFCTLNFQIKIKHIISFLKPRQDKNLRRTSFER